MGKQHSASILVPAYRPWLKHRFLSEPDKVSLPIRLCPHCPVAWLNVTIGGNPSKVCWRCRILRDQKERRDYQRIKAVIGGAERRLYQAQKQREWRARNPFHERKTDPLKARESKLRVKFGITPEAYEALLQRQGGVCAICAKAETTGRRLAVDHCHKTGRIRGLLCALCNTAIGKLGDSPELVERALNYLREKLNVGISDGGVS
jgi:hypothetical protein